MIEGKDKYIMDWNVIKNKDIVKITPSIFYHSKYGMIEFGWIYWSFVIKLK